MGSHSVTYHPADVRILTTEEEENYRVPNWTSTAAFLALLDANFFASPGSTTHTRTEPTPSSSAVTATHHRLKVTNQLN